MGLFSGLLEIFDQFSKRSWSYSRKSGSLESRQTGSSGGMSTNELLIRLELVMGQGSGLPLMDYSNEIAKLSHPLQLFIFSQTAELSELSYDHANEFLQVASTALTEMEQRQYERWLLEIKQALVAGNDADASEHIKNHSSYTTEGDSNTVYLSDLTYTLEKLVYSIHKAELPLAEAELSSKSPLMSYTNNEVLYLPTSISHFDNYEDNHRLYKALTFQLLGQIQCQSADAIGTLNEGIRHHGEKYLSFFSRIETLRIDQYIKHSFPGLWRDIELLHESANIDYPSNIFASANLDSVQTSLH